MIPSKLKKGDHIRIIAPSTSMKMIADDVINLAKERLEQLGYSVSFSKNIKESNEFSSSSIESRIQDLHSAFTDTTVDAVLTVVGGFNSNQLLRYIDFSMIKENPKIFCGFSDVTALQNAILRKTGVVTYSGPHFSTFGMLKGIEYTRDYFAKCLSKKESFRIEPSTEWSDDKWYLNQENRKFFRNEGFVPVHKGEASGKIIGGNLSTFSLLCGTGFMPKMKNAVFFVEDDADSSPKVFDRMFQSVIQQPGFEEVNGILIGRFQNESKMTNELLQKIINTKRELNDVPVIANLDFGHTTPQITYPIGGNCNFISSEQPFVEIVKH